MRISRTVSAFAAVVHAYRSSDPVNSGYDVLSGGADARSSKYIWKVRNCLHTCAKGGVIPGLTDGLVGVTARALMANFPHMVFGRVA